MLVLCVLVRPSTSISIWNHVYAVLLVGYLCNANVHADIPRVFCTASSFTSLWLQNLTFLRLFLSLGYLFLLYLSVCVFVFYSILFTGYCLHVVLLFRLSSKRARFPWIFTTLRRVLGNNITIDRLLRNRWSNHTLIWNTIRRTDLGGVITALLVLFRLFWLVLLSICVLRIFIIGIPLLICFLLRKLVTMCEIEIVVSESRVWKRNALLAVVSPLRYFFRIISPRDFVFWIYLSSRFRTWRLVQLLERALYLINAEKRLHLLVDLRLIIFYCY